MKRFNLFEIPACAGIMKFCSVIIFPGMTVFVRITVFAGTTVFCSTIIFAAITVSVMQYYYPG